jgi:hypothetical protein
MAGQARGPRERHRRHRSRAVVGFEISAELGRLEAEAVRLELELLASRYALKVGPVSIERKREGKGLT